MRKNSLSHDFNLLAPYYDRGVKFLLFPFGGESKLRKQMVSFLKCENLRKGSKILEIGCGTGSNLKALDKGCPEYFELVGLDLSGPMVEEARKKKFTSRVKFILGDAAQMPFSDESFESVLAAFTLHEMLKEVRLKAVSELHRILKIRGCALIVDFSYTKTFIGKALFALLKLIESKEALEFAYEGSDPLFSQFNFVKKEEKSLLFGLIKVSVYYKIN